MTEREQTLDLARLLLRAGAGVSARNVLGGLRGAEANRVRVAAASASLHPGVYALLVLPSGEGIALPLRPTLGHPRADDSAFYEACIAAHACVAHMLGEAKLPMLRLDIEEELAIAGASIGLPAALAFLAYFVERKPSGAVLATGRLNSDGTVASVAQLEAKLALAHRELGVVQILVPSGTPSATSGPVENARTPVAVQMLREAVQVVFGTERMRVDTSKTSLEELFRRARTLRDVDAGANLLAAINVSTLSAADHVRLLFDRGTLERNRGQCHEAARLHAEAARLLDAERLVLGGDASERFELESYATELGVFRVAETMEGLEQRLLRPFLKARNLLRCRGMLAEALATAGRFAEASDHRRRNLELHQQSDELRRGIPFTLCQLTLEAAMANHAEAFDAHCCTLMTTTAPGDEHQWRFSATVAVRGLVALATRGAVDRYDQALRWAQDQGRLFGVRAPATFVDAIGLRRERLSAPELSAMRAVIRALRCTQRAEQAIFLATRALALSASETALFGWLAELLRVELALCYRDGGHANKAQRMLHEANARMRAFHPQATAFYPGLSDIDRAEAELDRVWV